MASKKKNKQRDEKPNQKKQSTRRQSVESVTEFAEEQLQRIRLKFPELYDLQKKVRHPFWLVGSLAVVGTTIVFLFTYRPPEPARGRWLYVAHCSSCHGTEGHGDGRAGAALFHKARDFRTLDRSTFESPEKIAGIIQAGIPERVMPAFTNFSKEDLDKLSQYVIQLSKERLP